MEPRPPTSENRYTRKAPYLLVGLLLILFRAAAVTGPDFDHYMHWSRAFQTLDTRIFLDEGHTLSPLGVPLSQWSHGPGLLYALCPVGCAQWMSPDRQALWISWIVTAAFWWAMVGLLRRASYGDPQWVIYGVLVAVVGTQLGFYSRSYASETLSQAVFALLALWVVTRRDWRALDALVVGCLAGLLAIIRSQLVIYALPLLALLAFDLWRTRGTAPRPGNRGTGGSSADPIPDRSRTGKHGQPLDDRQPSRLALRFRQRRLPQPGFCAAGLAGGAVSSLAWLVLAPSALYSGACCAGVAGDP